MSTQTKKEKPDRNPATRWTPKLVAKGWTPIADTFLDNYAEMVPQITSIEAMLIVHLISHKWDAKAPYPGFETLAKRMGMTSTSVRNHARSLERKGYLRREPRIANTNKFHLDKLFKKLEAHIAANPKKTRREQILSEFE
jgi:DNA-binding transcriptional MocR family regulator